MHPSAGSLALQAITHHSGQVALCHLSGQSGHGSVSLRLQLSKGRLDQCRHALLLDALPQLLQGGGGGTGGRLQAAAHRSQPLLHQRELLSQPAQAVQPLPICGIGGRQLAARICRCCAGLLLCRRHIRC